MASHSEEETAACCARSHTTGKTEPRLCCPAFARLPLFPTVEFTGISPDPDALTSSPEL